MSAVNRHHPHPDQLVDWAFGAADPADAAAIEQHLGGCEACRRLVADLGDLDQLEASSGWSDDDLREALGQLRQRVLVEETLAGKAIEAGFGGAGNDPFDRPGRAAETEQETPILDEAFAPFTPPALPAIRLYPPPWALVGAALILLVGFGLAFQRQQEVNRLTLQLAELDRKAEEWRRNAVQPLANLAVVVARPFDDPSRGRPESAGQGVLVVIQSQEEALPAGVWRARLESEAGKKANLEVPNLVTQAGELRFYLPPHALPAGQYRLTLFREDTPWPQEFRLDLGDG